MSFFHLYNSLLSLYQGQEGQLIIAGDDDLRHTSEICGSKQELRD